MRLHGRFVFLCEDFGRDFVAVLLENGEFGARGHAAMGQLRVVKHAVDTSIEAVEQALVRAFEIVGKGKCAPHARVGELCSARIQDEGLELSHGPALELRLAQAAILDGRCRVACRPLLRAVLFGEIDLTGFQRFELGNVVPVHRVTDFVEVILADVDGKIFRPPVRYALVDDRPAGIGRLDAIGATRQWPLQCGLGQVARFAIGTLSCPIVFRQDRQQ